MWVCYLLFYPPIFLSVLSSERIFERNWKELGIWRYCKLSFIFICQCFLSTVLLKNTLLYFYFERLWPDCDFGIKNGNIESTTVLALISTSYNPPFPTTVGVRLQPSCWPQQNNVVRASGYNYDYILGGSWEFPRWCAPWAAQLPLPTTPPRIPESCVSHQSETQNRSIHRLCVYIV